MSNFILTFDVDQRKEVLAALKTIRGVALNGKPMANGTVLVKTITRTLDDETAAVHSIEDIPGVIDLRLLD